MKIYHNLSAINLKTAMKFRNWEVEKTAERVASGLRINRAKDDAAGMAVSELMNGQIRGLRQAERNTEDGISLVQTAEGYMENFMNLLMRMRELAVQSANGVYSAKDRQMMQVEVSALVDEMDRVASQAEFNKFRILQGDFSRLNTGASMWFHMGANMFQRERIYISTMTTRGMHIRDTGGSLLTGVSTIDNANRSIGLLDDAIHRLNKQRADLGAYQNRLEKAAVGILNTYEQVQSSSSLIRHADVAEEMIDLTRNLILHQTSAAMLAQANVAPGRVMQILQS